MYFNGFYYFICILFTWLLERTCVQSVIGALLNVGLRYDDMIDTKKSQLTSYVCVRCVGRSRWYPEPSHQLQVSTTRSTWTTGIRSRVLSLPRPFTPDLKLVYFTNPFLHSLLFPSGLTSRILTCTELSGHWRLFVLVSFVCFLFMAMCARLSWPWLKYMTIMTTQNISNRAGLPENPKKQKKITS